MTSTLTQGHRRPDGTSPSLLAPGEYVRRGERWWLRLPVTHGDPSPRLLDDRWTVTAHDDETITVAPSILDRFLDWHGYLERGVWRQV